MVNIEGLSFGYRRGALFKELALGLTPGNIYGLLGVNGAGKSTLLKLISGLLFASSGTVRSLGSRPGRASSRASYTTCSCCPRTLQAPNMLAHDYLRARAPFYPRFDRALFDRYSSASSTCRRSGNLAALSHGQQKKFLLAFGLASQAKLVLLDEPTNGLDIPSKSLLRRVVAEALTDDRLFVISTHQVRDLGTLMDPIVILHQGRVLLNRTLTEIGARVRMTQQSSRAGRGMLPNLLVQRAGIGGFWSVWRGGGDGPLDLEVLFNAIVAKPDARTVASSQPREVQRERPVIVAASRPRCCATTSLRVHRSVLLISGTVGGRGAGGFGRQRVRTVSSARGRFSIERVASSPRCSRGAPIGDEPVRSPICTAGAPIRRFCCCRLRRSRRPSSAAAASAPSASSSSVFLLDDRCCRG